MRERETEVLKWHVVLQGKVDQEYSAHDLAMMRADLPGVRLAE